MLSFKLHKHIFTKKKYFYTIVVISTSSVPFSGKFIEKVGYYNPLINN